MPPIPKPSTCEGCPFQHLSLYFTPDKKVNSKIAILGQAPGRHEERGEKLNGTHYHYGKRIEDTSTVYPQPLIGASGNWLRKEFWPLTQLDFSSVSLHNVIKCRPYDSNELPSIGNSKVINKITVKDLKAAINHCTTHHLNFSDATQSILAMGEIALYALTGEELLNYKKYLDEDEDTGEKSKKLSTVIEWRGSVIGVDLLTKKLRGVHEYYSPVLESPGNQRFVNVFPTVHLASLFESSKYYHATLSDFKRFGKFIKGEWPKALPEMVINELPKSVPTTIGFDTEYTSTGQLTMWSLATLEHKIYVVDAAYSTKLVNVPEKLIVITQNGKVDLPHLKPLLPEGVELSVADCMLGWAIIHAGEPTSLDYQLSICGSYNRHKHLREGRDEQLKYLYSGLDAETTLNDAWKYISSVLRSDSLLREEYLLRRGKPLFPILAKAEAKGIEVYRERVDLVKQLMDAEMERIDKEAKEVTGIANFNIRSPGADGQVAAFLYNKPAKATPVKKQRKKRSDSSQMELL